jgi:hypothetical protein
MLNQECLRRIQSLHTLFLAGEIPGPQQHELHPDLPRGSRENYLYFTLSCSLNFQRSSPSLWRAAFNTYSDPETRWVFFPELTCKRSHESLAASLGRYSLAVQTNKHPRIWSALTSTLRQYYKSDPREVLAAGDTDVVRVLAIVQKERRDLFPYLGGIKLSNYWLFIISQFTDANLFNLAELSIIPDTHVIKGSLELGVASEGVSAAEVDRLWRPILKKLNIPPAEMHSALWRWSRAGFTPEI